MHFHQESIIDFNEKFVNFEMIVYYFNFPSQPMKYFKG